MLPKGCQFFENIPFIKKKGAVSVKFQSNFIEMADRHGCSPVNLLHFFRTPFPKNTSGELLSKFILVLFIFVLAL